MKKVKYLFEQELQEAGFRSGKAAEIAQKIGRVLSKRIMTKIGVSPVPEQFSVNGQKLDGYTAFLSSKEAIRLNFRKGSSDVLYSIDKFRSGDDLVPEITINLNGYNIIQVLDMIVDIINGEWRQYNEERYRSDDKRKIIEKITLTTMAAEWLNSNQDVAITASKGRLRFSDYTDEFLTFIQSTFGSSKRNITGGALQYNVKKAIEQGLVKKVNSVESKNIGSVSVEKGVSPDKYLEDSELKKLYSEVFDDNANAALEQIEDLEMDVRRIADNDPTLPGLFIHGKAGVGKTQVLNDVFAEKGINPVVVDIPIGRWDNFLQIIWENYDGKVIVFDDNDTVLENPKVVGLLKKVLDSKPVRKLEITPATKLKSGEIAEGVIEVTSKIVFISNYMLKDIEKNPHLSAIKSRLKGVFHYIDYDPEQLIAIIRQKISGFASNIPGATPDLVKETLDFVEGIQSLIKPEDFDFRVFNYCLGFRVASASIGSNVWKKRILKMVHNPEKW